MAEQLVPVKRTVVTMREYIRAVIRAWKHADPGPCTKGSCAVLYAQYMIETGGAACWNWNVGNVKHVKGDGYDYHELRGVWEGVSPVTAGNLIAAGLATADNSPDHAKAVGPGRVSVLFQPPHPATWFRAFPNLATAMEDHLKTLAKRFAAAWPAVIAGSHGEFARLLKSRGYFTASAEAYAAGMARPFHAAMQSTAYDDAMAEYLATLDAPTVSEMPPALADLSTLADDDETPREPRNAASQPTMTPQPIVHVPPHWYRDPPDDPEAA